MGYMKLLKERIIKDSRIAPGNVLKVDSFLNHQLDIDLYNEIGKEFQRRFADKTVTKILTIEASGIGIACIAAQYFHVPVVFAKKSKSKNIDADDVYISQVESFTHKNINEVMVSKKFIAAEDHVLIIDDFLANGKALMGLLDILEQAGATVAGAGIVIEKGFQIGGKLIRERGIQLESLAIIDSMDDNRVAFRESPNR